VSNKKLLLRKLFTPFRYLWAFPITLLGLSFVLPTLLSGGRVRVERGALEVYGGFARIFLRRCLVITASAMCIGHVILGQDRDALEHTRDHEHVHVRQCERWGAFIIPAYLISSFLAWRSGKHFYFDNRFEREAYGLDAAKHNQGTQS
jgi:hypothetical protein